MKRKHKIIFATASIILILAVSVLPAFAFPAGPASINFCGLGTEYGTGQTQYLFTMEKWDSMQNNTSYPDAEIYWDVGQGGFEYRGFPDFYIDPGDTICITLWWLGTTGGMALMPYSNPTDSYYIFNEMVIGETYQGTSKTLDLYYVEAYQARGLAHPDNPNWSGTNGVTGGFGGIQDPAIEYIEFWYTYNGNESQNVEYMSMRYTTIMQGLRIQDGGAYGVYGEFMQYNQEWFMQGGSGSGEDVNLAYQAGYNQGFNKGKTEGYSLGYNDGYTAGYIDGGVVEEQQPIQSWSNFIFTGVTGFLSFEIYPGFPLWGLLGAIIAIPLLIAFLKLFAGG